MFAELWREHKWEIIVGFVFAVAFGLAWEGLKVLIERADRVPPERLASGTVHVFMAIDLKTDAQRRAAADWQKDHFAIVAKDFAIVAMGSGFAVTDDGWIVTAAHILDTKKLAPLLAATGQRPYVKVAYPPDVEPVVARQPIVDFDADVALVKLTSPPANRFLVLGESETARLTDRVAALGYPQAGDAYEVLAPTVTTGEISKIGHDSYLGKILQTTVEVGPGSSGGPLVDSENRVIGVAHEISTEARNFTFFVAIDHAREMLRKEKAKLPSHYERQGLLRQPATLWVALVAGLALLIVYFADVLRPIAATAGRLSAGLTAFLIDFALVATLCIAVVVVLIRITGRFLPWYFGVFAALPLLLLYAILCKWRRARTLGRRIATTAAASRWRLLATGLAATALLLLVAFGHLGYLYERALDDMNHGYVALWMHGAPDAATVSRVASMSRDRMAWFALLHNTPSDDLVYDYGLTLMMANAPREAIRAFAAAAGDTWEALATPGRSRSGVVDPAATKTGWCYVDLGDYAAARRMFTYVLRGDQHDADALLGLAVTCMRSGDGNGMRSAYAQWTALKTTPRELTPAQLQAVRALPSPAPQSPPAPQP